MGNEKKKWWEIRRKNGGKEEEKILEIIGSKRMIAENRIGSRCVLHLRNIKLDANGYSLSIGLFQFPFGE